VPVTAIEYSIGFILDLLPTCMTGGGADV
jgi:hypothetical protein